MRKQYKIPDTQLGMFDFSHPVMPVFDRSRCEARLINYETAARMVETYHYAHRVPSIVVAVGMFVDGILAGVCTYGQPAAQMLNVCGDKYKDSQLELTRLFIFDWAGRNSESWLVGQSFKLLAEHYKILVSYADTGQNHIGYIYQATNWIYCGTTKPELTGYNVNGHQEYRRKSLYDMLGSQSLQTVLTKFPDALPIYEKAKHRYVYFLGNKRQRKELRQALKWPVLPYPKGDDFDASPKIEYNDGN